MSKIGNLILLLIVIIISITSLYGFVRGQFFETPEGYKNFISNETDIRFITPENYSRAGTDRCTFKYWSDCHKFKTKDYSYNPQETGVLRYEQYTEIYGDMNLNTEPSLVNRNNIPWYTYNKTHNNQVMEYGYCAVREADSTIHCLNSFDQELVKEVVEYTEFLKN